MRYNPRSAVPTEPAARAAWLTSHGVLPDAATLVITLPLATLAAIPDPGVAIRDDGTLQVSYSPVAPALSERYVAAAVRLVAETGAVVTELPAAILDAVHDEHRRASDERSARLAAETAAALAAAHAERDRLLALAPGDRVWCRAGAYVRTYDTYDLRTRTYATITDAEVAEWCAVADAEIARREAELAATAAADRATARALLVDHGTPDQVERYDEDVLPDAELLVVARRVLIPIEAPPYRRLQSCGECAIAVGDHEDAVDADEWATWRAIAEAAKALPDTTCTLRRHSREDSPCDCDDDERLSIRVVRAWAGRHIVSDYACPTPLSAEERAALVG